jgi:hypothetical protein
LDATLKKKLEESADLIETKERSQLRAWITRTQQMSRSLSDKFVWTDYFHPVSPAQAEASRLWAEELYESGPRQRKRRWEARRAARREARALAKLVLEMLWEKLFGSGVAPLLEEYDIILEEYDIIPTRE